MTHQYQHDYRPSHNAQPTAFANACRAADEAWRMADSEIERGLRAQSLDMPLVREMQQAARYCDWLKLDEYDAWMREQYPVEPSERQEVTEIFYTA